MGFNACILAIALMTFTIIFVAIYYSPSLIGWLYPWTYRSPKSLKSRGLRDYWSIKYRIASYYNTLPDYIFRKYWILYSLAESAMITVIVYILLMYQMGTPPPDVLSILAVVIIIFLSVFLYISIDRVLMREYEKYVKWISK